MEHFSILLFIYPMQRLLKLKPIIVNAYILFIPLYYRNVSTGYNIIIIYDYLIFYFNCKNDI